jgi:hypothetical protein
MSSLIKFLFGWADPNTSVLEILFQFIPLGYASFTPPKAAPDRSVAHPTPHANFNWAATYQEAQLLLLFFLSFFCFLIAFFKI